MTKLGTPIGAAPKSAIVTVGLVSVGVPSGFRSASGSAGARVPPEAWSASPIGAGLVVPGLVVPPEPRPPEPLGPDDAVLSVLDASRRGPSSRDRAVVGRARRGAHGGLGGGRRFGWGTAGLGLGRVERAGAVGVVEVPGC